MKKFFITIFAILAMSVYSVNSYAQDASTDPVVAETVDSTKESAANEKSGDEKNDAATAKKTEKNVEAKIEKKESGWDKADKWIDRITGLIVALLSIIGLILGWTKQKDWRQKLKTERWKKIFGYADMAFPVVEKIAKSTGWKGDDKLVEFLKRVNDWLRGEGEKELNTAEIAVLKKDVADKAAMDNVEDGEKEVKEEEVKRG